MRRNESSIGRCFSYEIVGRLDFAFGEALSRDPALFSHRGKSLSFNMRRYSVRMSCLCSCCKNSSRRNILVRVSH